MLLTNFGLKECWIIWIFGNQIIRKKLIQNNLTGDFINDIAKCISLNPNIIFPIKIMKV